MLAGSTTAASTISTDTSPVHSPPAARSGRRRGLSYLRNYTFGLDSSRTTTPTQNETEVRSTRQIGRSRTAPAPDSSANTDAVPDPLRNPDSFLGLRSSDNDPNWRMTRRSTFGNGLDGAGISTTNEFTRIPPLPVVPSNHRDTEGAREALLARADIANALNGPGPSIQFIPASEHGRNPRPSLDFKRITRVLPHLNSVIRVGRYSERDNTHDANPSGPSDAPIGFKSKVVSRKHCEFFFQNGQWFVRDVKSSSGTFLNHIRLSQPGLESKPFPINDGDVIQLGIDFKGGEEMIFRCVKIRIETNRGWQRGLNKFNKSTHKQLQRLAKGKKEVDNDTISKHSTECTICLNPIAPCQALFVAPCSHTWHYKCIRTMLESSKPSAFLCPNCRAQADLDADVEEEELEDFEAYDEDAFASAEIPSNDRTQVPPSEPPTTSGLTSTDILDESEARNVASPISEPEPDSPSIFNTDDLAWTLSSMSIRQNSAHLASLDDTISAVPTRSRPQTASNPFRSDSQTTGGASSLNPSAHAFVPSPSSTSEPVPVPSSRTMNGDSPGHNRTGTLDGTAESLETAMPDGRLPSPMSADVLHREGPLTPRNAAGPFVFDGGADTGRTNRSVGSNQGSGVAVGRE